MLPFAAITAVLTFAASGVHGASSASIAWRACSQNKLIECGAYQVPLDYANTSVGHATLAVARYKSYRSPRLGTLFVNPGGPGGSGTDMIHNGFGEQMSNDTNGQYDVVGWDPRGVNLSTPAISCGFTNQEQLSTYLGTSMLAKGVQGRGNFTDQRDIDHLYGRLAETDSIIAALGRRCAQYDGGVLRYIGSAAAARDIISMSDTLEGPGKKINYWGVSYGTIIGNYLVNMFPDRVGRVIIDGVVDATAYATQPTHKMWTLNTASVEATFSGFTQSCAAAGPGGCAIAQKGSTPASIAQWVRTLIDMAYDANLPDIGDSFSIRDRIMSKLYTPQQWVQLAEDLAATYNNLRQAAAGYSMTRRSRRAGDSSILTNGQNLVPELIAAVAITCVDSIDSSVTTKEVFDEMLRVTREETPMFGTLMSTVPGFHCHHFPIRAVERFTGPFNHALSYPILVIGNEADPITPFASAKAVSDLLGNSAYLVEQDDYGHSSLAERSDCTRSVISDYFLQGKLPEKSKFCGTNQVIFPGPGVTKGTIANAVSDFASTTGTDNDPDSQIDQLRKQRTTFLILASVLAGLAILLAIILVVVIVRNGKNKRYAAPSIAAASVTTHGFSDGRGSMEGFQQPYSEPWEGKKAVY